MDNAHGSAQSRRRVPNVVALPCLALPCLALPCHQLTFSASLEVCDLAVVLRFLCLILSVFLWFAQLGCFLRSVHRQNGELSYSSSLSVGVHSVLGRVCFVAFRFMVDIILGM